MTAKYKLSLLPVLLMAVLCLILLGVRPVAAEEAVTSATAEAFEVMPPRGEGLAIDDFDSEGVHGWSTATNVASLEMETRGGHTYLTAKPSLRPTGDAYTVMRIFSEGEEMNLMERDRLMLDIYIPGDTEESYTARLTLYSGMNTLSASQEITGGLWYRLSVSIGEWDLRTYINMIEISVKSESGKVSFAIGGMTASGEADTAVVDAFMTFGFEAEGGEALWQDGVYLLSPGSDGAITLAADAARPAYTEAGGVGMVRVVLDNAMEGGLISLAVSDMALADSSFTIASSATVCYGENTYLLTYPSDMALHAYRLSFHDLYRDGDEEIVLRSVSLETFREEDRSAYLGDRVSCSLSGDQKTLRFSGRISASVAADYIGGHVELYEIPLWRTPEEIVGVEEPLASLKLSTVYSFSMDMHGRESALGTSRYQAYVVQGETRAPLSALLYPETEAEPSRRSLSVVGLSGADTAGVFDSNASSVIVDLYLDRLLGGAEGNTGGRLTVRGGRNYYLDYTYIRELDEEIGFYVATDVEVYLRVLCASDLSLHGYTLPDSIDGFYMPDVYSEAGANMLAAVTEYMAARYPSLSGFVLGYRLDRDAQTDASAVDIAGSAARYADTMRLIYTVAVRHIPSVYVIAPIDVSEAATAMDSRWDPVLLSVLISRRIDSGGSIPWGLMVLSDSAGELLSHARNILAQMRAADSSAPHEYLLYWNPRESYAPDILIAEYSERCLAAQQDGARVLFLSLDAQSEREAICAGLKYVLTGDDFPRQLSEFSASVIDSTDAYIGSYTFSDFSRSYSTLGWSAGSGCDRIGTHSGILEDGGRTLEAVFGDREASMFSPVSGSILWLPAQTENLLYAPHLVYTLMLTTQWESTAEAELVFIFGSGDTRAEYSVRVPTGIPTRVLCDLSMFSDAERVDFSAITVHSDSPLTLEISRITGYSMTADSDSLAALYRYRAEKTDAADSAADMWTPEQKMLLFLIPLGSVMVLALLSRRRVRQE